ncbi:MAG: hypothetical protein ABGX27_07545 [Desulfurobacteriaceae bacterium]
MSIDIFPNTKIYIACPANIATGGPELLHQLAYHLINDLNVEVFIYYYNFNKNKFEIPVHPDYRSYNVPYVLEIPKKEITRENILIVPEVLEGLELLNRYKDIRKGVWFLSVDNYYFSKMKKTDFIFERIVNKFMQLFNGPSLFEIYSEKNLKKLVKRHDYRKDPFLKSADFYMVNSYRGMEWFNELRPLYYLSEYLNSKFLNIRISLSKKKDIIVYNPKKGASFTRKIISYAKNLKFVPLVNMTRQQVIETLQRAKVYIDFGNHPGKDRIPREAAILGCCVITGRRGSAKYFKDVPIPDEYKFEDKEENIPKIISKIMDCLENFEKRYKDFDYYRRVIKEEPKRFMEDLKKIFVKV